MVPTSSPCYMSLSPFRAHCRGAVLFLSLELLSWFTTKSFDCINVSEPTDSTSVKCVREIDRIVSTRRKLLESIQVKSVTVVTLKMLQESIAEVTEKSIGFNTLRRFFGLLPMCQPSYRTWSVLDQYLQAKYVVSYNVSKEFMKVWAPTHTLHGLLSRHAIEALIDFLSKWHGNDQYPFLLGQATNHFIGTRNVDMLVHLYSQDVLFKRREAFSEYLAEIVGTLLRELPPAHLEEMSPAFQLHHFRESILYFFVDYLHLDGYYGKTLRQLSPQSDQEALFLACLQGYHVWLKGEEMPSLPVKRLKDLRNVFPVLAGRYVGCLALERKVSSRVLREEYISSLSKVHNANLLLFETIPALILLKDFDTLRWIYNAFYEELYELDHWFAYQSMNVFLIGESLLYISEGNLRRAKVVFDSIQIELTTSSYFHYTQLFHCIAAYNIQQRQGASRHVLEGILQTQYDLVSQTGFTRFTSDFTSNYFS